MRLRDLLRQLPIPEEEEARRRSHAVVRAAFAEREPTPEQHHYVKPALALAVVAAIVAAAASPPGRAVLGSLRKTVAGEKRAAPELFSLPSGGRLLVNSPHGPWIVQANGSRRRLGDYREASWSPHGKYVVAERPAEVVAMSPQGDLHWTLPRPRVHFARWGGSHVDTRVAYLSGSRLHMVAGDGTGDVDLCGEPAAAPVAPEWQPPGLPHVLAYADVRGRVYVLDADRCSLAWRSAPFAHPHVLRWSSDGRRLLLVTRDKLVAFDDRRARPLAVRFVRGVTDAAFRPGSHQLALVRGGEVLALTADRLNATPRRLFRVTGRIGQIAWSPNGRWLLVTWPDADQFLFVRGRRIRAVSGIARQFGGGAFPSIGGWCCTSS
jgi:WD40-like Beta Propeller Repeat